MRTGKGWRQDQSISIWMLPSHVQVSGHTWTALLHIQLPLKMHPRGKWVTAHALGSLAHAKGQVLGFWLPWSRPRCCSHLGNEAASGSPPSSLLPLASKWILFFLLYDTYKPCYDHTIHSCYIVLKLLKNNYNTSEVHYFIYLLTATLNSLTNYKFNRNKICLASFFLGELAN